MGKPKIRFKGYTEDWEQRELEDFGKATGGTSIESEFSEDGIYKVISIGSYSENSVYNDQGIRAIKSDKTSNRVLNRNDLTMILNDKTTSGNIIGRVLLIEESGIYVYNQRTERIEINLDEYDPVFLYEMLNAPNIREKIIKQAQGNTQIYVNWTAISLLEYMIPSKEEQVKIGEYLHSISNLITLHQRKREETKKLKKYMLQKMFPQNGQTVPEIRFAGFTEDWEQRELGDIITEYKETVDSDCILPILTSSKTEGVILQEEHFGRKQQHDITGYNILPRNYCTYRNRSDGVDFTFNINKCCDKGIISKFYPVFSGKNSDVFFLSLVLNNSEEVVREIAYTCTGTGQKVLSFLDLQKMKVRVPNFDEQKEIAAYFEALAHLITLHQKKCEELQKIKKFMLQNMFV